MQCPNCATTLTMSERQGIEIDYCPQCRGVWLDRGELDKIIERNAAQAPAAGPPPASDVAGYGAAPPAYGAPPHHGGYHRPYRKRRKSFLEELFD